MRDAIIQPVMWLAAAMVFCSTLSTACSIHTADAVLFPGLEGIRLPEGFHIETYAENVPGARSLSLGAEGTIFVGSREGGKVYALRDEDGKPGAERTYILAEGLNSPNGVAFRDGALYVAEIHRILRYDRIEERLQNTPQAVVVRDDFPREEHHGWKFIAFGPDGKLYVPVGAPCNVCDPEDDRFASIMRMNPDGSGLEVYAHGVRNTVGFDWHPRTGELWFTDNGRDWLGDDRPPDEMNRVSEKGQHFGFPYFHGRDIRDPEYGNGRDPEGFVPAAVELGPHAAALGMRFYTGAMFPKSYHGQIFIAEHGSWNRKDPLGYRVTLVRFKNGQPAAYEIFAEGWLVDGKAFGRPVDVLIMPDGALLVSDDRAGRIYRISYEQ